MVAALSDFENIMSLMLSRWFHLLLREVKVPPCRMLALFRKMYLEWPDNSEQIRTNPGGQRRVADPAKLLRFVGVHRKIILRIVNIYHVKHDCSLGAIADTIIVSILPNAPQLIVILVLDEQVNGQIHCFVKEWLANTVLVGVHFGVQVTL